MCYSSYNQEDSVIMNQSSIDRGLFRCIYYRSYMDIEKKSGIQQLEEFEKPSKDTTLRMKHGTYDELEDDGLIAPGTGVARILSSVKRRPSLQTVRSSANGLACAPVVTSQPL